MSLDGYINNRKGSVGRLYRGFVELQKSEILKESIHHTGAIVMGKNAYNMNDPDLYADNYEFQVPIFVLCENESQKRPKESSELTFTFVTKGVENAIDQEKKRREIKM